MRTCGALAAFSFAGGVAVGSRAVIPTEAYETKPTAAQLCTALILHCSKQAGTSIAGLKT